MLESLSSNAVWLVASVFVLFVSFVFRWFASVLSAEAFVLVCAVAFDAKAFCSPA